MEPTTHISLSTHVGVDTPCQACGYNLVSLRLDGTCPECGGLIGSQLKASILDRLDSGSLVRLRSGIWMIAAGMVLGTMLAYRLGMTIGTTYRAPSLMAGAVLVVLGVVIVASVIRTKHALRSSVVWCATAAVVAVAIAQIVHEALLLSGLLSGRLPIGFSWSILEPTKTIAVAIWLRLLGRRLGSRVFPLRVLSFVVAFGSIMWIPMTIEAIYWPRVDYEDDFGLCVFCILPLPFLSPLVGVAAAILPLRTKSSRLSSNDSEPSRLSPDLPDV